MEEDGNKGPNAGGCLLIGLGFPLIVVIIVNGWFSLIARCSGGGVGWGPIGMSCDWNPSVLAVIAFCGLSVALVAGLVLLFLVVVGPPSARPTAPPPTDGRAAPPPSSTTDELEQLDRLGALWKTGDLTDEEFQSAKAKLLDSEEPGAESSSAADRH